MTSASPMLARGADFHDVATYEEIASKARAVRALLATLDIPLHRDSALSVLLWDAESEAEAFREQRPTENEARAVLRLAQANRITSAILTVGNESGARECLRRMTSGELDLSKRSAATGKDALWELELVEKLRLQGFEVSLREPDLVLDIDGKPYPIACKRTYSERSVEIQMRKGVQQLERFGSPGLVAFNIDELTPAGSIFASSDSRLAGDQLAQLNRNFIDRHVTVFARFVGRGKCHGVIVNTSVVSDIESSKPRISGFSQTTPWTLSGRPASAIFDKVARRFRGMCA